MPPETCVYLHRYVAMHTNTYCMPLRWSSPTHANVYSTSGASQLTASGSSIDLRNQGP